MKIKQKGKKKKAKLWKQYKKLKKKDLRKFETRER